ncbi:hypothetical protein LC593_31090 [Nostoc sp. CHAB 5844]|nr:hypothetical protein [Nostoc sp. CHAB 5844]
MANLVLNLSDLNGSNGFVINGIDEFGFLALICHSKQRKIQNQGESGI